MGGLAARPAMVGHTPTMGVRSAGFGAGRRGVIAGGVHQPFFFGGSFRGGRFHHHHHRFFFVSGGFFPGYSFYGPYYPYYPYYYPMFGDYSSSYDSSEANYQQQRQMASEIDRLSNEVARLREAQEMRAYAAPAPAPQPPPRSQAEQEPARPTALVFRDRRMEEVNNYAIVGQTLWIFSEQRARKVPLAELDLPATTKLNEERGVEFRVPGH
jgi:hypothetical protein